jgi:hypothetical protein
MAFELRLVRHVPTLAKRRNLGRSASTLHYSQPTTDASSGGRAVGVMT